MQANCVQCKAKLDAEWRFCPLCGATDVEEPQKQSLPEEHQKAPVQGAFSGLLIGIVAVPVLIIPGALLCLTGLGALLGIPMIILGVLAPLVGPMMGLGVVKGNCPWCGAGLSSLEHSREFSCPECGKPIAVRHREFISAV